MADILYDDPNAVLGPSSRVGEFFYAKSGSIVQGYLAVTPGAVTNGAVDFPVWAAMYPEFVSGADIVFPADVDGMFLRNIGGNAAAEGTSQADATAANGLRVLTSSSAGGNAFNASTSMFTNTGNVGSQGSVIPTGDTETRPANRAYQLYTIVDNYNELALAGMVTPTALQNGIAILATNYDIAGTGGFAVFEDVTTLSVTVPSAGRWKLEATIRGAIGNGADDGQGVAAVITDASNAIVNDGGTIHIIGDSDALVLNSTVGKRGNGTLIAYVTTTGAETFKIRASQATNIPQHVIEIASTLRYEELPAATVVDPAAVVVDDQTATGYFDIGDMRMAWGTTTGTGNLETVTFPGGGFGADPSVTFAPRDTILREIAVNSVSPTQTVLEAGGSNPKMWQAMGPKP